MENPSTWTKRGAEQSGARIKLAIYCILFALVFGTLGRESGYFHHCEIMRLFLCMLLDCYPIERKQLAQEKNEFLATERHTQFMCDASIRPNLCQFMTQN